MTEPMRALVLTPDFPPIPGGIQLLMHRLVSHLASVQSRVVALGAPGADEFDAQTPLDVFRVASKEGRFNRLSVARLNVAGIRQGLTFRPGVVVSGHVVTSPASAALGVSRRIPVIQYLHGDEFRHRPRLVQFAVRRADAVVAVSRHASDLAIAARCDPGKVHVVHPGVDLPVQAVNGRAERPTVLTVSRMFASYKGHDSMIRALPRIRQRVPAVEWVVIGDGPLRPKLEAMAASAGIADSVRFLGKVPDRQRDEWLGKAHVFALPSRLPKEGIGGEGFGIVYLEAGAHGLPVVGVAEGGALDAIVDGETGRLVAPTDHEALANAVVDLLVDPERAAKLGEAGAQRARRFSWERHAHAVERLVHEVSAPPE